MPLLIHFTDVRDHSRRFRSPAYSDADGERRVVRKRVASQVDTHTLAQCTAAITRWKLRAIPDERGGRERVSGRGHAGLGLPWVLLRGTTVPVL